MRIEVEYENGLVVQLNVPKQKLQDIILANYNIHSEELRSIRIL